MYQVIIVIHVLLGLGVIGLVLMQQGKGADAGAAFGSGSAGSVFGAQGAASFLSRSTAILATLFFATSLGLAIANGHRGSETDLMTAPATEQDNSGLPAVEGAKNDIPPAVTQPAVLVTQPVAPVQQPVTQPAVTPPVPTVETPKVEETKPVEEAKPVVEEKKPTETKKPVEHKPASKDKKAADHKVKDAKKDH
ncbi:MAG: preprotein translocase subunit SecG [Methylococcales bacterium]|nr:preprotein translocase subunit SecG [Methylococcales bacterium]